MLAAIPLEERDRFVQLSYIDQRTLVELDSHLLAAARNFEALELSPLAPLGARPMQARILLEHGRLLAAQRDAHARRALSEAAELASALGMAGGARRGEGAARRALSRRRAGQRADSLSSCGPPATLHSRATAHPREPGV